MLVLFSRNGCSSNILGIENEFVKAQPFIPECFYKQDILTIKNRIEMHVYVGALEGSALGTVQVLLFRLMMLAIIIMIKVQLTKVLQKVSYLKILK